MPCFHNLIWIGPGNKDFSVNDGGGVQAVSLTAGSYNWDTLRNEILARLHALGGNYTQCRMGISSTGYVTLSIAGGANISFSWTDADLGTLLGFTQGHAGSASYTAPRRIRGAYYLNNATVREHDPKPSLTHCNQTRSLAGTKRTTTGAVKVNRTTFELQYLDNSARLVSPAGAVVTSYANAAATELGLTEYAHARDAWWDSTDVACQGWSDGRPVRYFEDAADATLALASGAATYTAADYSTWIFDVAGCKDFPGVKARPPKTTLYNLTLPAEQYVAP